MIVNNKKKLNKIEFGYYLDITKYLHIIKCIFKNIELKKGNKYWKKQKKRYINVFSGSSILVIRLKLILQVIL